MPGNSRADICASRWGLSAGIVSALYRGSVADIALMSLATVGIAVPSFVIGGLSIMLFVFVIPIFPRGGLGNAASAGAAGDLLGSRFTRPRSRASLAPACSMRCRRTSCARPARKG